MRKISGRFGAVAGITAFVGMMLTAAIAAPAQTFTLLHSFDYADGTYPKSGLVQATDGNLYGTTSGGGANSFCTGGCGTVFRITPSGTQTTLHNFCLQNGCADGRYPYAALIQALDGSFYGTTYGGPGTIFKITSNGTLTTLYNFCSVSECLDGESPTAELVQATDGNFYGTTFGGGSSGYGTIFKITPSGTLTTLYSFCSQSGCTDGQNPAAGLVRATDGYLYGTTPVGGAYGYGTVFKITLNGTLATLHSFDSTDGASPWALIQGTDGDYYGTTQTGGANNACGTLGCGTVFKITPTGMLSTLYSFCSESGCADGNYPYAGLVQATDGNFYGTTPFNGIGGSGNGTIFRITPSGTLTTLHTFDSTGGSEPFDALLQDTNGTFYGTTFQGGDSHFGTVFNLALGLKPFVEAVRTYGKAGKTIAILGTKLSGATSVTFNGTAATFTVELPTGIKAIVPVGATTGPVQVVTPSGTLTSNVNFRVEP